MRKIIAGVLAEFLINIGAGWFLTGYGALFLAEPTLFVKLGLLTVNLILASICLGIAIWLRKRIKK